MEIWKHLKTNSLYLVFGEAICSTNGERDGKEKSVLYYSVTAQKWFYRESSEFYDGRFVKVEAPEWKGKKPKEPKIRNCFCQICDFDYEYCTCPVDCPECEGVGNLMTFSGKMDCHKCDGTGRYEK